MVTMNVGKKYSTVPFAVLMSLFLAFVNMGIVAFFVPSIMEIESRIARATDSNEK